MTTTGAKVTYVFCAVQAGRKPRLNGAPGGPPGLGARRLLDAGGGLWLVVADAPLARYGEEAVQRGLNNLEWLSQCAIGHETVVEQCLRTRAVVPMKLFTIFANDFRALTEIGRRRREIDKAMTHVGGRREWGVRIRIAPPRPASQARARSRGRATGVSYLAAKKQARDVARELALRARTRADSVFTSLAALSADARRHPPPAGGAQTTRLLLDAAFLVAMRGTARFRAAARRAARSLSREGYGVELTGPWPPYNFIEP